MTASALPIRISQLEQIRRAKQGVREQQHRRVRELQEQGLSIRMIASQLGMPMTTVARYRHQPTCPNWNPGRKAPSVLDAHRLLIDDWIKAGGRIARDLQRLLATKGCCVSYECVRRYLTQKVGRLRQTAGQTGKPLVPRPAIPSARKLSFQFICPPKDAKNTVATEAAGPSFMDRLRASSPALNAALDVASE